MSNFRMKQRPLRKNLGFVAGIVGAMVLTLCVIQAPWWFTTASIVVGLGLIWLGLRQIER